METNIAVNLNVSFQIIRLQILITFQINRESAEHLIDVTVSVPNRQKVQINISEDTTINETLQIGKHISIFAFPESDIYF